MKKDLCRTNDRGLSINLKKYNMKLEINVKDVAFETLDTSLVSIDIVNNVIKIEGKYIFNTYVLDCLRDTFDKPKFECDFDDNTYSIIYIRPLEEGLIATIIPIEDSKVVAFGYVEKYLDVAAENIEED